MKKKLSTKNTRKTKNKSKLYKKRITKKRKLIKKNIRVTPLKNSNGTPLNSSTKLPVTISNDAPMERPILNLHGYKGGADDEDENKDYCPICWDPLLIDNTFTTKCGHKFHKECIIQTCRSLSWNKQEVCLCPYCRRYIDQDIANAHFNSEGGFDRNNLTLETFPLFINNYLSLEPEENPDNRLELLLYSFDGLDILPFEIHDLIMEFKKMNVASRLSDKKPLYIYYLTGFVNKKPTNTFLNNKKYYTYYLDEDAITYLDEI